VREGTSVCKNDERIPNGSEEGIFQTTLEMIRKPQNFINETYHCFPPNLLCLNDLRLNEIPPTISMQWPDLMLSYRKVPLEIHAEWLDVLRILQISSVSGSIH
jgi:hypothetical protein